ncbi:MAG: allophanate hydrolase subunit 1 [bacterium]|nr:allophanate hydrolase subunit 1 [bacterium]
MRPVEAYEHPRLSMVGEALLIVEFGVKLSPDINDIVIAFDHFLQDNPMRGLLESAPMNKSVALRFDPLYVPPQQFRDSVLELVAAFDAATSVAGMKARRWRFPVCYGGEMGPDLAKIADQAFMSEQAVIAAHCSLVQRVFMIGFAPGFLYTGMLPDMFKLPRLPEIKPMVSAGSVSVAICQTVISSTPNPTGWHVIGSTPFRNFDPDRDPPFLIGAGDEIAFYAIDLEQYKDLRQSDQQGMQQIVREEAV